MKTNGIFGGLSTLIYVYFILLFEKIARDQQRFFFRRISQYLRWSHRRLEWFWYANI